MILVTGRLADYRLYAELTNDETRLRDAAIRSVTRIGDCLAPSSIADAIFSGHRYAREFDENAPPAPRRERPPYEESH
ncbi:MAG: hypothetical protein GTN90_11510 [Xanthomonadales bacterium]|nr:hypothetical protein [Xanthomonadales bacterium]